MAAADWEMRVTAPELSDEYFAAGYWTDATLTDHVVAGLTAHRALEFRV